MNFIASSKLQSPRSFVRFAGNAMMLKPCFSICKTTNTIAVVFSIFAFCGSLLMFGFATSTHGKPQDLEENGMSNAAMQAIESVVRVDVLRKTFNKDGKEIGYRIVSGSGFVIDIEGHIATAAHLLVDAFEISVTTAQGVRSIAEERGSHLETDIAVLKVSSLSAPPLNMSAEAPENLARVAALGSPLGLDETISFGRVTGIERSPSLTMGNIYVQHDAAINPGSSGGPLIDSSGQVIGMNLSLPINHFDFAGIGFAVESAILQNVVAKIIHNGSFDTARLGLRLRDLTAYAGLQSR